MNADYEYNCFGFEYEWNGSRYAFDIVANDEEEARARAEAMKCATFVGKLVPEKGQ